VSAYDGQKLVGHGRILFDGALYGLLVDLIVWPSHQRRGIGSELLNRLVVHAQAAGLRDLMLLSATGKGTFYERYGFVARSAEAPWDATALGRQEGKLLTNWTLANFARSLDFPGFARTKWPKGEA